MSNEKMSRGERKRLKQFAEQGSYENEVEILSHHEDTLIIPEDDFLTDELKSIRLNDRYSEREKKRLETLALAKEKNKKDLVAQLRKTPIAQLACEKTGVGRSTYYKWRAEDKIFARACDKALEAGRFFINDMAESKLIQLVQERNPTAIIFWLKHNHPNYVATNKIIHEYEVLTSKKLSVEEKNVADQEIAKMLGARMMPTITREEARIGGMRIKQEYEEVERNIKQEERLKSFEEE